MLLPQNIEHIIKSTFGNKLTDKHLSFTNLKRKEINHFMMNKAVKRKEKSTIRTSKIKI
jgi:hypothetical protein